jgi:DNA-3-methyladenine glycosylase II
VKQDDIDEARRALCALDAGLARAHSLTPPFVWRRQEPGFSGLIKLLIGQQISTAAAAAIWERCAAALEPMSPEAVLALTDADFRSIGFSGAKVRYARALAEAVVRGDLQPDDLVALSDEDALQRLVATPGIGPWTASVYLLFCEGRADLCPEVDVALREALRRADGADFRLSPPAFRRRAAHWSPFRGVAAHLLWAFYRTQEGRLHRGPGGLRRLGGVAKKVQ